MCAPDPRSATKRAISGLGETQSNQLIAEHVHAYTWFSPFLLQLAHRLTFITQCCTGLTSEPQPSWKRRYLNRSYMTTEQVHQTCTIIACRSVTGVCVQINPTPKRARSSLRPWQHKFNQLGSSTQHLHNDVFAPLLCLNWSGNVFHKVAWGSDVTCVTQHEDLCDMQPVGSSESTQTELEFPTLSGVVVRSPFRAKHHVVVQCMAAGPKCPPAPSPVTPLPCGTPPTHTGGGPPCSQTPLPLLDPPLRTAWLVEDKEDQEELMNKEGLTTLPMLQGTSHYSCLEHCFLFILFSSAIVVDETSGGEKDCINDSLHSRLFRDLNVQGGPATTKNRFVYRAFLQKSKFYEQRTDFLFVSTSRELVPIEPLFHQKEKKKLTSATTHFARTDEHRPRAMGCSLHRISRHKRCERNCTKEVYCVLWALRAMSCGDDLRFTYREEGVFCTVHFGCRNVQIGWNDFDCDLSPRTKHHLCFAVTCETLALQQKQCLSMLSTSRLLCLSFHELRTSNLIGSLWSEYQMTITQIRGIEAALDCTLDRKIPSKNHSSRLSPRHDISRRKTRTACPTKTWRTRDERSVRRLCRLRSGMTNSDKYLAHEIKQWLEKFTGASFGWLPVQRDKVHLSLQTFNLHRREERHESTTGHKQDICMSRGSRSSLNTTGSVSPRKLNNHHSPCRSYLPIPWACDVLIVTTVLASEQTVRNTTAHSVRRGTCTQAFACSPRLITVSHCQFELYQKSCLQEKSRLAHLSRL